MKKATKRLTREEFTLFLGGSHKTLTNHLGVLKYSKNKDKKIAIVISQKSEKRATSRNKLRRRIRSVFNQNQKSATIILYASKASLKMSYDEIKKLFNELLEKI